MTENSISCLILAADATEAKQQVGSLLSQHGFNVTYATTSEACMDLFAADHWPLLIIDTDNGHRDFLDTLSQCKTPHFNLTTVVLVKRGDIKTTVHSMKAGAADCIEKPIDRTQLLTTVTILCRGPHNASPDANDKLTKTERLVLHLILDGQTSPEIAETLCRSPRTIDVHRRNIMKKMNVDGLVDLVRQTLGKGIHP